MVKSMDLTLAIITCIELFSLSYGKPYHSDEICRKIPVNGQIKTEARTLAMSAKDLLKKLKPVLKQWEGKKRWNKVCPLATQPEKDVQLNAAIAISVKYLSSIEDKFEEARNLFHFAGCDCTCMKESSVLRYLQKVRENACYMYLAQNQSAPYNGNYDIPFDSILVGEISIKHGLNAIRKFGNCVSKKYINGDAEKSKGKVQTCINKLFKGCKRRWTKEKRGQQARN